MRRMLFVDNEENTPERLGNVLHEERQRWEILALGTDAGVADATAYSD